MKVKDGKDDAKMLRYLLYIMMVIAVISGWFGFSSIGNQINQWIANTLIAGFFMMLVSGLLVKAFVGDSLKDAYIKMFLTKNIVISVPVILILTYAVRILVFGF